MSSAIATSSNTTTQPGQTAAAHASAATKPSNTILVAGQPSESVGVQSQLATSHIPGEVTSRSNIGQVIGDLGSAHNASGAWLEQETAKVSQWGQSEIARVLQQTKAMEEALVLGAKEKQKALDASHSGELAKLVQELDLRKAAELKELEDGLQRQIQATLSSSKSDINRVESEMNMKKMELLKQSQLKSAKEIDTLSNLVVETKLVPSQTRTVIETNTQTGNVLAVATGGHISTGSAQAESHTSQKIAAIPNAGELKQASDVTVGNMVHDATGQKVGTGAIVNTQTRVTEQPHATTGQHHDVVVPARPLQTHTATVAHPSSGLLSNSELNQHHATHPVVDRSAATHHDGHMPAKAVTHPTPIAGAPIASGGHTDAAISRKTDLHTKEADNQLHAVHKDGTAMAHGHHAASSHDSAPGAEHQHGLLCKVKHALGMETKGDKLAKEQGVAHGEPRATEVKRV